MKFLVLVLISVFSMSAFAGVPKGASVPKGLKSCAEHLGDVRTCIETWPKTVGGLTCSSTVKSGDVVVDEFSLDAINEVFTTNKDYCGYFTETIPYGDDGTTELEYCCGG